MYNCCVHNDDEYLSKQFVVIIMALYHSRLFHRPLLRCWKTCNSFSLDQVLGASACTLLVWVFVDEIFNVVSKKIYYIPPRRENVA
jgi:hypothetical protein